MPTEDTRTPGSPRRFWAVLCNPDRYRFDEDYQNRTESVWTVPRGDVHAGDGLLIWRAQGKNQSPRGIVAIATVLTEPEEFSEPEEFAQYWVNPQVPSAARRIWVRYERYTGLPLLLGGPHHQLLEQLTVSRAQGAALSRSPNSNGSQSCRPAVHGKLNPTPSPRFRHSSTGGRKGQKNWCCTGESNAVQNW